jgi:predicted alpha/beta hydrolase family esterase
MMAAGRIVRMAATVLVVQGAGDMHDPQGTGVLVRYLERELASDFRVVAPEMPDAATDPRYVPWRDAIHRELAGLEPPVLVVGHSVGGSVVLKMLSEGPADPGIRALFLVSVPWWGPEGWAYEEFAIPDDFGSRLPDVPTFLYHSVDDPEVGFEHLGVHEARMPRATVRPIAGAEHSFRNGLPEMVRDIRELPL